MRTHIVTSTNIQVRESTDEDIDFIIATETKEQYQAKLHELH
jgi:hypothetical protein